MVDMPKNSTKPNHIYSIYMYKEDGPGDWGSIPGQVIPKTLKNGT